MTKREIRQEMLSIRNGLNEGSINLLSNTITYSFLESDLYKNSVRIFAYASTGSEVVTYDLINQMLADGKIVALPRSYVSNDIPKMDFYEIKSLVDLTVGYKGIYEPDIRKNSVKKCPIDPDIMIIPGVAFDRNLSRIGYGKGFYDYYLSMHKPLNKVAFAYDFQLNFEIPYEEHDIKMDYIVTERDTYFVTAE